MLSFPTVLKRGVFLFGSEGDGMAALAMPLFLDIIWFAQFFFLKTEMKALESDLLCT